MISMSMPHTITEKNLYLVGFMGVGKSHFGRLVADELGFRFLDSDNEIEKKVHQVVPEIFKEHGEAYFRSLEKEFIQSGHSNIKSVVACGGGLVMAPGMMDLLKSKGIVVSLFASEKSILERTMRNENRPLLEVEDREGAIRKLLLERTPTYLKSHFSVSTEGRTVSDVVTSIARSYQEFTKRV
jgi:shikimate kinase